MAGKYNFLNRVIEILIVIFGAFIAFGLNTCNENRQDRQRTKMYLEGIKEELLENQKELTEKLEYHNDILDSLRVNPLDTRLVLSPAFVNNVSWKLSENEVFKAHIEPDLFRTLAITYNLHESLKRQNHSVIKLMDELNVMGPLYEINLPRDISEEEAKQYMTEMKKGWQPIFETWTFIEREYLASMERSLKMIEENE